MVRDRLQVKRLLAPAAVFLLAGQEPASAQGGFLLRSDRIDISGASRWRAWDIPFGTVTVDAAGVRPNFVRSVHNACLDAGEYPLGDDEEKGGIHSAGSNVRQASGMIDGREDTFWEPDLSLPPETWWVEVDLGRAVSARRVALRFVDEELGDPFLQFKVLVSTGKTIPLSKQVSYREVGRTERPNRRQREFSFDISPGEKADPDFAGDVIRFVQVVVTDSRLGKAEEISREDYEAPAGASARGDRILRPQPHGARMAARKGELGAARGRRTGASTLLSARTAASGRAGGVDLRREHRPGNLRARGQRRRAPYEREPRRRRELPLHVRSRRRRRPGPARSPGAHPHRPGVLLLAEPDSHSFRELRPPRWCSPRTS